MNKDKLIDFRNKKTVLKNFKCINPTKILTKNKEYKGFISNHYVWSNNSYQDQLHVINDRGQHRSYSVNRFKKVK